MKYMLLFSFLALTLAACQTPGSKSEALSPPATTVAAPVDNRTIIETAYAHFANGDIEAFLSSQG